MPGGQRHHVLDRAGHLAADDVVVREDPEPGSVEQGLEGDGKLVVAEGQHAGRGQPGHHLPGQVRARQDADQGGIAALEHLGDDLGGAQERVGLDPLGQADQRRRRRQARRQVDRARPAGTCSAHPARPPRRPRRRRRRRCWPAAAGQRHLGVEQRVLAVVVDAVHDLGLERPQLHVVALGQHGRQGRAPRAAADDGQPARGHAPAAPLTAVASCTAAGSGPAVRRGAAVPGLAALHRHPPPCGRRSGRRTAGRTGRRSRT